MSRTSKNVIKELNRGIVPDELNFKLREKEEIDWAKIQYNTFYKTPEYFESKFPSGMLDLPGFDKVIQTMVDNAKTPLEEMNERQENISSER